MDIGIGTVVPSACTPVDKSPPSAIFVQTDGTLVQTFSEVAKGQPLILANVGAAINGDQCNLDTHLGDAKYPIKLFLSHSHFDVDAWIVGFSYTAVGGDIPVPLGGDGPANSVYSTGYTAPSTGGTITITWTGNSPGSFTETLGPFEPGGTGDGRPGIPNLMSVSSGTITATVSSDGSSVSINVG